MRAAGLMFALSLLAACELQPAPPPPAAPPAAAPSPAPVPEAAAAAPTPAPPPAPPSPTFAPPSNPCEAAGVHLAEVLIAEARDPQQKATLEQERDRIVHRTEQACQSQKWSDEVRTCITTAKGTSDIQECQKKLQLDQPSPPPSPPPAQVPAKAQPTAKGNPGKPAKAGAGSGSGSGSGAAPKRPKKPAP